MNVVILTGRLTKDPDIRYTQGAQPTCIARFSLAVDRRFKRDGEQSADFPNVVAFGKTAEFCEKYAKKGVKFNIEGRIQTGSYNDRNGNKVYTTDVVAERMEFGESKNSQGNGQGDQNWTEVDTDLRTFAQDNGFIDVPDNVDDDGLPFN